MGKKPSDVSFFPVGIPKLDGFLAPKLDILNSTWLTTEGDVMAKRHAMKIDEGKIDDAVLALLYLTLDRDGRAWKGFDWAAMNRLHAKGLVCDPVNKAKSVLLSEEGVAQSERLFRAMFTRTE
jgi:Domain of unknown function (DUF6429)